MNNFDRWRDYTDGLISPDIYINFGFYYMISAALQRRVWIGPPHSPLYPNQYCILVGDPGVGKGLVIKPVAEILRYHKLPDPSQMKTLETLSMEERAAMEAIAESDYKLAQEAEARLEGKDKKEKSFDKPLLYPVAADATTYEALIKAMSRSLRRIGYDEYDESVNKTIRKIYSHSSLCFCLEEISSLFRKKTEDVVHFLIQAYDCGDYTYDTKTQGRDRIKKCCLNFFGGTTPGFMQETFDDQLLTEGFASRTFFIFAAQNRKTSLWIPDLTESQKEAYKTLIFHIEKLSHLYGRVQVSQEDMIWLEKWWQDSQTKRPNTNIRLNPYYARKQIHVLKLAMAIHFSDSTEMVIKRPSFIKAIEMLAEAERSMHFALGLDANNPLAVPARKVLKFIENNGRKTRRELYGEFWEVLPNPETDLDAILEYLQAQSKIRTCNAEHPTNGATVTFYDVLRKSLEPVS